jgi:hypothetical protein
VKTEEAKATERMHREYRQIVCALLASGAYTFTFQDGKPGVYELSLFRSADMLIKKLDEKF